MTHTISIQDLFFSNRAGIPDPPVQRANRNQKEAKKWTCGDAFDCEDFWLWGLPNQWWHQSIWHVRMIEYLLFELLGTTWSTSCHITVNTFFYHLRNRYVLCFYVTTTLLDATRWWCRYTVFKSLSQTIEPNWLTVLIHSQTNDDIFWCHNSKSNSWTKLTYGFDSIKRRHQKNLRQTILLKSVVVFLSQNSKSNKWTKLN